MPDSNPPPPPLSDDLRDEALRVLQRGGVIAFPTDTVYGLAALLGAPGGEEELRRLKGRDERKPFTRFVRRLGQAARLLGRAPVVFDRLAKAFWPGPLTLVARTVEGDATLGFRIPDHPVALAVVDAAPAPLLVTSANRAGEPEATRARQVRDTFGREVGLVIEGACGPSERPSGVVFATDDGFRVVREGGVSEHLLRLAAAIRVLFVCTANVCRSPMAEQMFRRLVADRDAARVPAREDGFIPRGFFVSSAGSFARPGVPMSDKALFALEKLGYEPADHQSRSLNLQNLASWDYIFAMEKAQYESLKEHMPELGDRLRMFDPRRRDVPDPFGGDEVVYLECAHRIEALVKEALTWM
ncbi:MAG: Sua5/YciO/YrdC/YwlC family protein [Planctomycetes bacterium]|nr:Sua5/YciO/YrdC/YwlC family protein [Planctomycetota bacterium]